MAERLGATGKSLRLKNNVYSLGRNAQQNADIEVFKINLLNQIQFKTVPYVNGLPLAFATPGNPQQIYVDAVSGSDTLGTGSVTAKFQTIEKALTVMLDPAAFYTMVLSPGTYGAGPLQIPGNVSISGQNAGINVPVEIVFASGFEGALSYSGVSINDLTMDLSPADIALCFFTQGGFGIKRTDNTGGPHLVFVENASISSVDIAGSVVMYDVIFLGGPNIVRSGGQLLCSGNIIGTLFELEGTGVINMQSCVFPGAIQGTTIGPDTPTVFIDSSSYNLGGLITGCTIELLDNAQTIKYAPTTPSDWDSPAPETVQEGLDRVAALLKVLNGGTGP